MEKFITLSEHEMQDINGGIAPLVIGGVVITGKAIAAGLTFVAGVGAGIYYGGK